MIQPQGVTQFVQGHPAKVEGLPLGKNVDAPLFQMEIEVDIEDVEGLPPLGTIVDVPRYLLIEEDVRLGQPRILKGPLGIAVFEVGHGHSQGARPEAGDYRSPGIGGTDHRGESHPILVTVFRVLGQGARAGMGRTGGIDFEIENGLVVPLLRRLTERVNPADPGGTAVFPQQHQRRRMERGGRLRPPGGVHEYIAPGGR